MKPKNIMITGASRGIGRAIALYLVTHGYNIAINCQNPNHQILLEEIQTIAHQHQQKCITFTGNIGDYSCCKAFYEKVTQELGSIDCLINNAGISYIGLLQDMSIADWDYVIQSNLSSVFYCCKLVLPNMINHQFGKIINISSVWGNVGASCEVAYSASKGGINSLTRALAKELAPSNIQVNAIACGAIDTQMNHFLSDEDRNQLESEIPAGRMASPEEVAQFVGQLLESNNYLTGQIIAFDGGWI